jgi:acyl-CoA hydrolase
MDSRKAIESFIVMNELVLPNDTNTFGNLMGGRLCTGWILLPA